MGLTPQPRRSSHRPPRGILDPRTGKPVGADDPFFAGLNDELADKGFLVTADRRSHHLGAHRLADVDDVRARLLRGRDDADVDAALRRRALRLRAARLAAPVRRDDRRRHAHQQDGAGAAQGLRPDAGAALRHLDGLAAPTAAATTTIPTRWCAAATASCRSTSTCRAARRPRRRCSTACCCCRRRSAAPARSSAEGRSHGRRALGQSRRDRSPTRWPTSVTRPSRSRYRRTDRRSSQRGDIVNGRRRFLRDDARCQFVVLHRRHGGRLARRANSASTSSITCCRRSRTARIRVKIADRRGRRRCLDHRRLPGRRLVRARDLRPLRHAVHRPSRTCAGSSPTTASRAIRCARISRSPASSRCATTTSRSASSTSRCGSTQEFRNFDFLSPWEGTDYVLPGDEKAKECKRE